MPYLVRVARAALILSFASANWSFSSCTVVAFRTSSGATASATGLMSFQDGYYPQPTDHFYLC